MEKLELLGQCLAADLSLRPAGVDKLDRLWDAAVLLPLVPSPEGISLLFEVRSKQLKRQPGEICFPGGKAECTDYNLRQTVVRECCEELGLVPADIKVLGELDALVTHAGPIIHPFVGLIQEPGKLSFGPSEVEEVFTVPLAFFLGSQPLTASVELADRPGPDFPFSLVPERQTSWRRRKDYRVYFYPYRRWVIWGMTARILYSFLCRYSELLAAYVANEGQA